MGLVTARQGTSVGSGTAPQKEALLVQAGSRAKSVTTPKQRELVSALRAGEVSTIRYKGKLYYVHPTPTKDRILVGNQIRYKAYK